MIAIIGGGIAGLTAAIRLAKQGQQVSLFETAPKLGGRTRSFFDKTSEQWCDNGPHLLIGAYTATQSLLKDCQADHHIHWQQTLELPLWDEKRGHFQLHPRSWLPLPLAMALSLSKLPGHGLSSSMSLVKMVIARIDPPHQSVAQWLAPLHLPPALMRDFIEPLCLGTMNEYPTTAPAWSFQRVLRESFSKHHSAHLGWFTQPLSKALIKPLQQKAESLGVCIHTSTAIRAISASHNTGGELHWHDNSARFDQVILTTPAWVSQRLLGQKKPIETRPITNIHLWFDHPVSLGTQQPLLGAIGTLGQWYFDVSAQMKQPSSLQHIAVVISADRIDARDTKLIPSVLKELADISGAVHPLNPVHSRIIQEHKATVLTRPQRPQSELPSWLIDASEYPAPGDLPATIEAAVRRAEKAAALCQKYALCHKNDTLYPPTA